MRLGQCPSIWTFFLEGIPNKASEKYLNNNRYSTRSITYVDSDDRENRAGDGERQTGAE